MKTAVVIPVKADESAMVFFMAPKIDRPSKVTWKSDQPLHPLSRPVEEAKLADRESDRWLFGVQQAEQRLGRVERVHAPGPPAREVHELEARGQRQELLAQLGGRADVDLAGDGADPVALLDGWDGERVRYECRPDLVTWASGCDSCVPATSCGTIHV